MDENLHNEKMAWNQVLLTGCNVSRDNQGDELEEAMGNTANWESGYLHALQCAKDEALSLNLTSRPHVNDN